MSIDQSHHQPYQVILLGPDAVNRQRIFSDQLNTSVQSLGLDPAADCEILCFEDLVGDDEIRWCNAPVFVWCGAQDYHADVSAQVDLAVKALKHGDPVFAVVDNLDQPPFSKQVPQVLASFNGMVWERLPELATHVLQAFGMFRRGKRTFISLSVTGFLCRETFTPAQGKSLIPLRWLLKRRESFTMSSVFWLMILTTWTG